MIINAINGTNSQNGNVNMAQSNDAVSRSLRQQIANAQKELKELSTNEELSAEDKMKKRQELQQQITDLNNQLRQHQIELRREQQAKATSMDEMLGETKEAQNAKQELGDKADTSLSQTSMQALISADSTVKQSQVQGQVKTQLENRASVLESEIKLDQGRERGGNSSVETKEEELAKIKQQAEKVETSQTDMLQKANHTLVDAKQEEQEEAGSKVSEKAEKAEDKNQESEEKQQEKDAVTKTEKDEKMVAYRPVDIRL